MLYPIPPKNWTFVDLPRSVDDFNQICFILKYFSWSLCPTVGSNKDQPAGQQDVVGLGHLEDPHVGGQQHHLLPGVGWEIFQCCLWASTTKLSISLCDRSIDEYNARYQAVGLQLARGDLKWLTRLGNPENERKTSQNESNRTRTNCDWWCERRQALGDHQDQAVVDQVDHPGIT